MRSAASVGAASWSSSLPGPVLLSCSPRPAPRSSRAARDAGRARARSSRRSRQRGRRRSSCCPTTPTPSAQRRPPPTRRRAVGCMPWSIPTRAQVQGIAALAVHEPGRPLDNDVVQMAAAARGARHGAVTVAVKDAMTTAGPCREGDALGVVHGDFAIVGEDLYEVATGVLERLLGGGGELVTIVAGAEAGDLAQACEHWVGQTPPGCRRRRLRGWSGALPGARGGGVAVTGVQVRWDSPVAAVGGKHYKKIVTATGVETVGDLLGIYPASLRPQGVAERARRAQRGRHPLPGR